MSIAADISHPQSVEHRRDAPIDTARGIAMILVVFGHALDGAQSAGQSSEFTRFLLILIYTTHIPLFFLVSGVLSSSLCDKPWRTFLSALGGRVVWPYLLWAFTLLTVQYLMSDYTNGVVQGYQPLSIFWDAPGVLWFLYVLCIGLILRKIMTRLSWQTLLVIGTFCLLTPYVFDTWPQKSRFIGMFLIGSTMGSGFLRLIMHPYAVLGAGMIMTVTLWMALWQAGAPIVGYPAYQAIFIPAIFAGPLLVYALSQVVSQTGKQEWLGTIGRNTMAIFVTHILVTAGTRIVMVHLGVTEWALIIVTATCAGVALPLWAAVLARRWGLSKVLGWQ